MGDTDQKMVGRTKNQSKPFPNLSFRERESCSNGSRDDSYKSQQLKLSKILLLLGTSKSRQGNEKTIWLG